MNRVVIGALATVVFFVVLLVPQAVMADDCQITVTLSGIVLCSGIPTGQVVTLPQVTVSAAPVTLPVPPVTITLPSDPVTKLLTVPGPTSTVTKTVHGPTQYKTVYTKIPGPVQRVYIPGPTKYVPGPVSYRTTTAYSIATKTAYVTTPAKTIYRQRPVKHAIVTRDNPFVRLPSVTLNKPEAVGIGLAGLLGLMALILAGLYAGYYLGYKDSDRENASFMQALSDKTMYRGKHS